MMNLRVPGQVGGDFLFLDSEQCQQSSHDYYELSGEEFLLTHDKLVSR